MCCKITFFSTVSFLVSIYDRLHGLYALCMDGVLGCQMALIYAPRPELGIAVFFQVF